MAVEIWRAQESGHAFTEKDRCRLLVLAVGIEVGDDLQTAHGTLTITVRQVNVTFLSMRLDALRETRVRLHDLRHVEIEIESRQGDTRARCLTLEIGAESGGAVGFSKMVGTYLR